MAAAFPAPWTNSLRCDETSAMQSCRYGDRFSIVRVETTGRVTEPVHRSSTVPALLVSMSLRDVQERDYRLWVDGKVIPTGPIAAFRADVIDLAARPAMWGDRGVHYVHFHLRRSTMGDAAVSLGFDGVGGFRPSILEKDIVLAQIVKSILPHVALDAGSSPLALDHLELILAAHVMQRYGASRQIRAAVRGGLSAWQRRLVTEMLRESLEGRIRLADLARACDLSVSHFARSFRASFGVTCHYWLTERRIERAKDLLSRTAHPLADVAGMSGFADQPSFTRAFRRIVGVPPGEWRRETRVRG